MMTIKKQLFRNILLSFSFFLSIQAQDYQISFTASGISTTVDQVQVHNLTRGTSLVLGESDILHLTGSPSGIGAMIQPERALQIYPNPVSDLAVIGFHTIEKGPVSIEILDITGKNILTQVENPDPGYHLFDVSGLNPGIFLVKIISSSGIFTEKLISNSEKTSTPVIFYRADHYYSSAHNTLKNAQSVVQMLYNDGERLLFRGSSGNYSRIITLIPATSQVVNFDFVACTDPDGKNYSVVTIGSQTWMAENLAYLPSVSPSIDGSTTSPYYYVYGYESTNVSNAKNTANYDNFGVLYNWPAAMGGSGSCNGTGAPPNDACSTPVQGICPAGWHLPSHYEWTTLEKQVGTDPASFLYDEVSSAFTGVGNEGGNMKIQTICGLFPCWNTPNTGATNSSGFSGLPGGFRSTGGGPCMDIGNTGNWWTSTQSSTNAWYRSLHYNYSKVYRGITHKGSGLSVRCIKN